MHNKDYGDTTEAEAYARNMGELFQKLENMKNRSSIDCHNVKWAHVEMLVNIRALLEKLDDALNKAQGE